jgi:hypothetical protein
VDLGNMLERAVDEALQAMLPPDILNDRKAMALVRKQLAMKWITQSEAASFLNKRGALVQPPDPGDFYLARNLRIMECRVKQEMDRSYGDPYEGSVGRAMNRFSSNRIEMTFDAGGTDFGGLVKGGADYVDIVRAGG